MEGLDASFISQHPGVREWPGSLDHLNSSVGSQEIQVLLLF